MADQVGTIHVKYRNVEGYHVFTSDDVYGLYVASRDAEKAFQSLAPALTLLIHRNEQMECYVEHLAPYSEFVEGQRDGADLVVKEYDHKPLVLGDTQFLVRRKAA